VGCETESVREDAFYAGLPQRRQRGERFNALVDETIGALRKR
jgi:Malic enzyme, N-terminal domain